MIKIQVVTIKNKKEYYQVCEDILGDFDKRINDKFWKHGASGFVSHKSLKHIFINEKIFKRCLKKHILRENISNKDDINAYHKVSLLCLTYHELGHSVGYHLGTNKKYKDLGHVAAWNIEEYIACMVGYDYIEKFFGKKLLYEFRHELNCWCPLIERSDDFYFRHHRRVVNGLPKKVQQEIKREIKARKEFIKNNVTLVY